MWRADSRGNTTLLTVVAVVLVGGFMYYLYHRSQNLETTLKPTAADTASEAAALRSVDSLAGNLAGAVGERALFDSIRVAQGLGRGALSLRLNDTTTYPVLLNASLIQQGTQVYGGDQVTIGGRIYTFNDSIRQEWTNTGAVDSSMVENVPLAPSFLLADTLSVGG